MDHHATILISTWFQLVPTTLCSLQIGGASKCDASMDSVSKLDICAMNMVYVHSH